MNKEGLYTSGEFARKARVTVRTIRFYDKQNILKPAYVSKTGARYYCDNDFARLQQVLLLKCLGFSLEDIRLITVADTESHMLANSLRIQLKLIQDKIEQLKLIEKAIKNTSFQIEQNRSVDWSSMLNLIHLTEMENTLKLQYQNANNISARINLHELYSTNPKGWFPWVFEQCTIRSHMEVLEVGCGNGALWTSNIEKLPDDVHILLSDISDGMIRDARRNVGDGRFEYEQFDCTSIPHDDEQFDIVIANHVLFYAKDLYKTCREIFRVLKKGGVFICSTYGSRHMMEISRLVQEFDERIVLSDGKLYDRFGLDNGEDILKHIFAQVEKRMYEDGLVVDAPEPLIEYILSCHGNQNQYLTDRYKDFRAFITAKTNKKGGFRITKEAGIFVCVKN